MTYAGLLWASPSWWEFSCSRQRDCLPVLCPGRGYKPRSDSNRAWSKQYLGVWAFNTVPSALGEGPRGTYAPPALRDAKQLHHHLLRSVRWHVTLPPGPTPEIEGGRARQF